MGDNIFRLQPPQFRSREYPHATSMGTQPQSTYLPHFPLPYYYDYKNEK